MKNSGCKNNFSEYVRSIFMTIQPVCAKCGCNQGCALHHILSRSSLSMYNGIILCHDCHMNADCFNREGGSKGKELRMELLRITKDDFMQDEWWRDGLRHADRQANQKFLEREEVREAYNVSTNNKN